MNEIPKLSEELTSGNRDDKVSSRKERILVQVANAYRFIKDDNYLDACQSLEIATDLMHMTGKTGKPL